MSITLEELRQEWSNHSRRVDERLRLQTDLLREQWMERLREQARKLRPSDMFSIAVWIATMALLGRFLGTHTDQPALFVTAILLDIWVITAGIAQVRQHLALRNLDFSASILELQSRVESLRIARIQSFNIFFLTGQIVWWIPFIVVVVAGVFGVNLYSLAPFRVFAAWNIAAGIAFIPLAIGLSRRYGERLSHSSIVRHIADSIAGRDIAAAREYLEKLRRFGGESEGSVS